MFVFLAFVAALVGASDVASVSMDVAKWFVILFVVLALVAWVR